MTLPGTPEPPSHAAAQPMADPFGLWELSAPVAGEGASFGVTDSSAGDISVWRLDLTTGADGALQGQQDLDRRAQQLASIAMGLEAAIPRVDALLESRTAGDTGTSFAVGQPESPEASLAFILEDWDRSNAAAAQDESFGLIDDAARLAGKVRDKLVGVLPSVGGVDWGTIAKNLQVMMDSVNRQILHYAWVETTLDGALAARTTVNWGGDMVNMWTLHLTPDQTEVHERSLALALDSRNTSLRTVLTVSTIAGKLALAVTTPLGTLQALALGWQFVRDIIMPAIQPGK